MNNSKNANRKLPAPPRELAAPGRALWRGILEEFQIEDAAGLSLLASACRAEDDVVSARKQIAKDGLVLHDRFGQPREHPLLAAVRGSEQTKRQALAGLRLDLEPVKAPGRPGGR